MPFHSLINIKRASYEADFLRSFDTHFVHTDIYVSSLWEFSWSDSVLSMIRITNVFPMRSVVRSTEQDLNIPFKFHIGIPKTDIYDETFKGRVR